MRVDAWGVSRQVESCRRVGVSRVVLVSSLCAGRWRHPLNLFGLILVWKRVGERALETSGLDWTVIRPGGLSERDQDLEREAIRWSGPDRQSDRFPGDCGPLLCGGSADSGIDRSHRRSHQR